MSYIHLYEGARVITVRIIRRECGVREGKFNWFEIKWGKIELSYFNRHETSVELILSNQLFDNLYLNMKGKHRKNKIEPPVSQKSHT